MRPHAMKSFVCTLQSARVVFGAGALAELPQELDLLGVRHALVLSTPGHAELAGRAALVGLQREQHRTGDRKGTDPAEPCEHSARQPGYARPVGPQPQRGRDIARPVGGAPFPSLTHDAGRASVRIMRTRCCGSAPSRSSAAANNRSTIIWLPRTR